MPFSNGIEKGFTIIELVLIITLVSIISATLIPKFFSQNQYDERVFFDDVLNAIRYAQKLAVVSGCKVQVSINSNSYTLNRPVSRSDCGVNSPSFSLSVLHPGTQDASYTGSQSGVTLTSTVASFTFDALGRASSDVALTINGAKTINIIAETGLVYDST